MAEEAVSFVRRQPWCRSIRRAYADYAWSGILGIFLFEIEPAGQEVDPELWAIVGDVPPAYLCNDNRSGREALEGYVAEMRRWVHAVDNGEATSSLIPVNVPATPDWADELRRRLDFIETRLLPAYPESSIRFDDLA